MRIDKKRMTFVLGNVLRTTGGFPYNSKVFQINAVPGSSTPGCTGKKKLRHGD